MDSRKFSYNCENCGTEVNAYIPKSCISCGIKLCRDCQINQLCKPHFLGMNSVDQTQVRSQSKNIQVLWLVLKVYFAAFVVITLFIRARKFFDLGDENAYFIGNIIQYSMFFVFIALFAGIYKFTNKKRRVIRNICSNSFGNDEKSFKNVD
ncbi:hypothetical protein NEF87_004424 [Candidatus Lokiarchaeum ossiferum]|uniref:B box-type domain-containing protein n=1 Tax=Candidatus Lokiarchaeum ossiferum TaxID=2951803 RepID=A0ABY6HZZ2_9ARCH|nr:hypothetical protein NEF87_004424 [Candidatus Lokiarchaeum sp. B-35]